MVSLTAEVTGYSIRFTHANTSSQLPFRSRYIHLHFAANGSKLESYRLSFVTETKLTSTGTVEKQNDEMFRGHTVISIDEFADYYNLLRHERSLFVRADFDDDPDEIAVGDPIPLKSFTLFSGGDTGDESG
ncbi:hypothetical protein WBJ53_18135 [Spirosoma sp. SC4-14]|uniref:hypothetical protein n=1 Tax=Spirosoma sp. SC4-14 TaxID=3128900 RepID=UPI0030CFF81F